MTFSILLLISAISLSAVAAYYSIAGLVTLFPMASLPIVVMGVTLESAKLVSASWLYRNWNNIEALVKYYLTVVVVVAVVLAAVVLDVPLLLLVVSVVIAQSFLLRSLLFLLVSLLLLLLL